MNGECWTLGRGRQLREGERLRGHVRDERSAPINVSQVIPGSPAADFGTITLDPGPGYAVYGHHNDILTLVDADEVGDPTELTVGLHGRYKRDQDAHDLQIIHVEDRRPAQRPA